MQLKILQLYFKVVLVAVMATVSGTERKVQFCSLPAGLHQQAVNTLVSFLKIYMIKKNLTLLLFFSSLSASVGCVCVCV